MPATEPMRQLTVRAIVLGILLSAILAGANAYLGLFAGLTVSASIPAAVLSMAILRVFRDANILENNIVQTAASAGESLAAGVIFTFPALILLGYWDSFDYLWVSIVAGLGGLLGVMFTIPLRRSLIVEQNLAFPEGTATAEVLRAGNDRRGAKLLALAALTGGLAKFCETGLRLWPATAQAATYAGQSTIAYIGTNLSPALISVGFIVGLNVAVLVFLGGAIAWYAAIPVYSTFFLDGDAVLATQFAAGVPAADLAGQIWSTKVRYLGVGAMLVGGLWAVISMRGSLLGGIRKGLTTAREPVVDHREHDTPMSWVMIGVVLFVAPIAAVYYTIVGSLGPAVAMTLVMVVAGFLFSAVAAYMAGLVGSSHNPVSGVTIATILFASLLLLVVGDSGAGAPAAIMVGAVVCSAAAIGGDNMQDLKAGYLLGATPWRQQLMQAVGVVAAVLVMAPILNLLLEAYGFGAPSAEHPNALAAPQAQLMASVADGVFGGSLPWGMVGVGALIGIAVIVVDEILKRRGAAWRAPVLAVAVGIYLPLELSVPILAGGLIAQAVNRVRQRAGGAPSRSGILFAAGLITGEALVGIGVAVPIVVSGTPDVLALGFSVPAVVGLIVIAAIAAGLYRVASRQ